MWLKETKLIDDEIKRVKEVNWKTEYFWDKTKYTPVNFLSKSKKRTEMYDRDEIKIAYFKETNVSLNPFLKSIWIWRNNNTASKTKWWFKEKKAFMKDAFEHIKSDLEQKFEEGTEELYWELWFAKAEWLRLMAHDIINPKTSIKDRDILLKALNNEIWAGDFRDTKKEDKDEWYKISILSDTEDEKTKNTLRDADEGIEKEDYYLTKKEIEW